MGADREADESRPNENCGDRGSWKFLPRRRRPLRFDRRGLQPLWRSPARGEGEEAIAARSRGRRPGRRGVGRSIVLLEIFVARHWIPMRWRDLARLAVFTDPFTSLRRPAGDAIHPNELLLHNDA